MISNERAGDIAKKEEDGEEAPASKGSDGVWEAALNEASFAPEEADGGDEPVEADEEKGCT